MAKRIDCVTQANRLAKRIRAKGGQAVMAKGTYHPRTSPSKWAPKWRALAQKHPTAIKKIGVQHAWVRTPTAIIDPTADLFGSEPGTRRLSDRRYREYQYQAPTGEWISRRRSGYDERKHPRYPKGHPLAGKWSPKK